MCLSLSAVWKGVKAHLHIPSQSWDKMNFILVNKKKKKNSMVNSPGYKNIFLGIMSIYSVWICLIKSIMYLKDFTAWGGSSKRHQWETPRAAAGISDAELKVSTGELCVTNRKEGGIFFTNSKGEDCSTAGLSSLSCKVCGRSPQWTLKWRW